MPPYFDKAIWLLGIQPIEVFTCVVKYIGTRMPIASLFVIIKKKTKCPKCHEWRMIKNVKIHIYYRSICRDMRKAPWYRINFKKPKLPNNTYRKIQLMLKNCYGICMYRGIQKREPEGCTPNHEGKNEVGLPSLKVLYWIFSMENVCLHYLCNNNKYARGENSRSLHHWVSFLLSLILSATFLLVLQVGFIPT